ncbi:MAG: SNF2 helicase associated domain-containing protein, partial [Clostridia bacterium]|nr:SNF2 helicase associated domain-containing protein [Clostridia bacterium]
VETTAVVKKSDAVTLNLISEYSKLNKIERAHHDYGKVEVVPQLKTKGGVSLRFTIGEQKKYMLKDISEFVSLCRVGDYKRYGVKLEFYHTRENFTAKSRKLVDFIVETYTAKVAFFGSFMHEKDELRLDQGDIDEFIAMNEGELIKGDDGEMILIEKFDSAPPIKIKFNKDDEGYSISLDGDGARFIEGGKYYYLLVGETLYRVSREFARFVKPFLENLQLRGKIFVANADTAMLYNGVLAKVGRYLEVESEVDLTQFEAIPLTCELYLSYIGGRLSCESRCSYDGNAVDLFGDVVTSDFVRDWECENAIRAILAQFFPRYPQLYIDDEGQIFDFMTEGIKELLPYAEIFMGENMKKLSVKRAPKLKVGVRLNSDLLEIGLTAPEYTTEQIEQILSAYRQNRRYIKLDEGFITLDGDTLGSIAEVLDASSRDGNSYYLPRYYAPMLEDELLRVGVAMDKDEAFGRLSESLSQAQSGKIDLPQGFDAVMRHYQKVGYGWLKTLKENGYGGILADDMGLGKTIQALALFTEKGAKSIVVCPTTLMYNWASEVEKFAPTLKTVIVTGSQQTRRELIEKLDEFDLVITSYELMRRDYALYEGVTFDYAVVDEAQYVKNPETKNATSVKKLNAKHRFALTGTPVENNLGELWSLFDFIMPSYLGSYSYFREKYESGIAHGDEYYADKLKKLIKPFILRRLKSEVLSELPLKTETVISVPMREDQERVYKANLSSVRQSIAQTDAPNRVVVLSMLMKLRQICCDPRLVYGDYIGESAKTEACVSLIREAIDGGHKILVFSQFTKMLDILAQKLGEDGVRYYTLKGETPKAERLRLVNKFNTGDVKVFLISLKAGGTGINLTGADVVIHYDPWWNESAMNQATDRAYRIGQNKPVTVYKLIAKDSIEEKIVELGRKKSELSSLVVGQNNDLDQIIKMLTDEEND